MFIIPNELSTRFSYEVERQDRNMASLRLLVLVAVCAIGGLESVTSAAETRKNSREGITDSDKPKRDVNIIGPVPSGYRGQATGRTTFDGILADDLQLPAEDSDKFQALSFPSSGFGRSRGSQTGRFQAESRPNVYNFDGKEYNTYDGVLASDLTVPNPYFAEVNPAVRSAPSQEQYFVQRLPQTQQTAYQPRPLFQPQPVQPVVRQANFASGYQGDLNLPATAPGQLQTFQRPGTVSSNSDPSLFTSETPLERYNRLQQQYQEALAEYRSSLLRFREQLKTYSNLSQKK